MRRSWIYIAPLKNFKLGDDLDPTLEIGRVTFVRVSSLDSSFKTLGIPQPPSHYVAGEEAVFPEAETVAVLTHTGEPEEVEAFGRYAVSQAIEVLACSMYGWARRWHEAHFGAGLAAANFTSVEVLVDRGSSDWRRSAHHRGPLLQAVLDEGWRRGADEYGSFYPLLRVLARDAVRPKLRQIFWSAARFAGRSWLSYPSLADALLFGWVALEQLLRKRGESATEVVPRRAAAAVGVNPLGYARTRAVQEEVLHVYGLRNDLVHGADESGIEPRDILFLDDVLHNTLGNLARLAPAHGRSQGALHEFLDNNFKTLAAGPGCQSYDRVTSAPHYNAKDLARVWTRIV